MATRINRETQALWQFLDHVLDAYALSRDIDDDAATFAMLAAFAAAERLSLSEKIVSMMGASALAEIRKQRQSCCRPMAEIAGFEAFSGDGGDARISAFPISGKAYDQSRMAAKIEPPRPDEE